MRAVLRHYDHAADYGRVGRFLVRTYRPGGTRINWLQPRWAYMHHHPLVRAVDLRAIGVWEAQGDVVAVVHPEHAPGIAYLEIDPAWGALAPEMLDHAEAHLGAAGGREYRLGIYVNDRDADLQRLAGDRGYARGDRRETMLRLDLPAAIPPAPLPPGYRLASLADDNDLPRVTRIFWRGFGHGEEPPDDGVVDRAFMQSAPDYRRDLNIVVVAPDGTFASYCGTWYEPERAIAYVEPVATDPAHRRKGLGRAAVLEGIRRCAGLGAGAVWVGSDQALFFSIGFRTAYVSTLWHRGA